MSEINREIRPHPSVIPPLDPSLLKLSEAERAFLHDAISRNDDELRERLFTVQKHSYEAWPYPCIRAFHFVWLFMIQNPIYEKVLEEGKKGDTVFLDIGCCMGTDARKLVLDGYPASNVLACDLRQEYIDIGYQLYQDQNTCAIRFFSADMFDVPVSSTTTTVSVPVENVTSLAELQNTVMHLYAGALFHLFDEPTQYAIALRLALLLKRSTGAIVFGRHQGKETEGLITDHMSRVRYGHSPASWTRLWKKVFAELEGGDFGEKRVIVDAELRGNLANVNNPENDSRMLYWSVRII